MIYSGTISLQTGGECDVLNITSGVAREVSASGLNNGLVTVFVSGSTAAVTTIEYEPGVVADFKDMWERIVPRAISYEHDRAWEDGNGYSHVRASILGPSLTVPFNDGRMALGTWQQIVLVDFDNRPRSRQVLVRVVGE